MRELIDCHVHTQRCGHASGTTAQMVSAAVFTGLTGIVISEHLPLPEDLDRDRHLSMHPDDLADYTSEVKNLAARVKGVQVVLGAESDWLPDRHDYSLAQIARARSLGVRVLLGSVHFVDGWAFDDPSQVAEWERRVVDEVWESYFTQWIAAARSRRFDVMAHPDLPKKFGHRPAHLPLDLFEEAARAAADSGVAVEVSTAGLRKPVAELYPGAELLATFHRHGVPVTVGSDAHAPSEVGHAIAAAYETIASIGYTKVAFPIGGGDIRWIDL